MQRRRYFISKITGKRISISKVSFNPKLQTLRELQPKLSAKGARRQLKYLKVAAGDDRSILRAEGPNYQRWFRWIAKNAYELLPKNIQRYVESEYPEDADDFLKLGLTS